MRKTFFLAAFISLLIAAVNVAPAASTPKKSKSSTAPKPRTDVIAQNPCLGAIVIEARTGKVLYEEHPDAKGYPASCLKLMDLLLILEKIDQKQLSLQDQVPVSAKAAKTGGSQVYLAEKESFTVEDMLYALMVQSANDSAVALAEKVAGSTDAFVELMNKRARELGMTSTTFHSVHGLPPAKGQDHDITTARDFSLLCRQLILHHPQVLTYTSTRERSFRQNIPGKTVVMRTHNHLLGHVDGVDGLKTGYITAAGFSIAVTAARNNQRIIVMVLDSVDRPTRDKHATELVAKGFAALSSTASSAATPTPAPVTTAKAKSK